MKDEEVNQNSKNTPNEQGNFFCQFNNTCLARPQKKFIECPGKDPFTFETALFNTNKFAAVLKTLGVDKGDRVAVMVDKSADAVLLYLACLQVGAIYLPLNTAYTSEELNYFIDDSEPTLFVCQPILQSLFASQINSKITLESLGDSNDGTLLERTLDIDPLTIIANVDVDDVAAVLYTSGTTGRSKGAMLTHGNLSSNCRALIDIWQFSAADRLIHALPIFHTHGLFVACNMVIVTGASMFFLNKFDEDQILDLIKQSTILMGVPTFYTRLLKRQSLTRETTAGFRLFISGSAPLNAETHSEFKARTGHAILERYGMTETCMITSNPLQGERRPGTVGMPLPNIDIRIVDRETRSQLAQGKIGSIEVRGPNVFKGYWRMPEKTAAEMRKDGYFITGDLGRIDKDGYLQIVGRDKDLVISGGYNIYPKEVEQAIDDIPSVIESAVIGLPHPDLGEAVTAIVVKQPDSKIDGEKILATIAPSLARYKQPKQIILADSLPRNTMSKVMKNKLRDQYSGLYQ